MKCRLCGGDGPFQVSRVNKCKLRHDCPKCRCKAEVARRLADPAKYLVSKAQDRARRFGHAFSITATDITPLPKFCPVFGTLLCYAALGKPVPHSASLDRIDSTKGYIAGNVAVMSFRANTVKNFGTAIEHEQVAAFIRKHLP